MARDPLLRDAVRAIKTKIGVAAETATPEELAYLGTAIDRIGGRATVLEVEEMGDIKIAEITEHAASVESQTIASITATKEAAEASVTATKEAAEAYIVATRNAAQAEIDATKVSAVNTVNAARDAAVSTANTNRDAVIAEVNAFKEAALADVAAAAGSVTQQLVFGARAFFYAQM